MERTYIVYYVGKVGAHNLARRLRRRGYEAHVLGRWVKVYKVGPTQDALLRIRNMMARLSARAIEVDWGVCE